MIHLIPNNNWHRDAAKAVEHANYGDTIVVDDEIQRKVVETAMELRRPKADGIQILTKEEHEQGQQAKPGRQKTQRGVKSPA